MEIHPSHILWILGRLWYASRAEDGPTFSSWWERARILVRASEIGIWALREVEAVQPAP